MVELFLDATPKTPHVSLNAQTGRMIIKGRSIPSETEDFWHQITNWFENYSMTPCKFTLIQINLEYFNITSSKQLLTLLYKLNEIKEDGFDAKVEWHYREDDLDMYEVGQDYAFMVKIPFEFIKQSEYSSELVSAI